MEINGARRAREHARDRRIQERRFVRRTAAISAAALCLLLAVGAALSALLPGYYQKRAGLALARGNTGRAASIAGRLPEEQRAEILNECAYIDAVRLYEGGDFDAAAGAFLALGGYRDAADMLDACVYEKALLLMNAGEYTAAKALLGTLLGYGDALYRYDLCSYRLAEAAHAAGDAAEAIALFLALGEFEDARARAGEIAIAVTGIADPETALLTAGGLDEAAFARRAALSAARRALRPGLVAAGFFHTLAVCEDGSVLAAGDNGSGQCAVAGWTQARAVAAGAYHSLALRADGTVLAAGDNSFGQCEVGGWKDVVAIAAGDYNSFALMRDGTVKSCGRIGYPASGGWRDAVAIAAGAHALGAVRGNGTLLASHPSNADDGMRELVACAVSTGYTVGLTADGRALANAFSLSGWDDVIAVSASPTTVLGLRLDGGVYAHSIRGEDLSAIERLSGVTALAAGGTHCVLALSDGSVRTFGSNEQGQCDTADWRLFG